MERTTKSAFLCELAGRVAMNAADGVSTEFVNVKPETIRRLVEVPSSFAGFQARMRKGRSWGPPYSFRRIAKRRFQRVSGAPQIDDDRRWRRLAVPNPLLRRIQDVLLELFRATEIGRHRDFGFPADVCGAGLRGPLDGVLLHQHGRRFVSVDVADFFGSVSTSMVEREIASLGLLDGLALDSDARRFVARACTLNRVLPQGAPTSPLLANLAFRDVDDRLRAFARDESLVYTRYFDDLCFSFGGDDPPTPTRLKSVVVDAVVDAFQSTPFRLNKEKTRSGRRGDFRITGYRVHARGLRVGNDVDRWIARLEHSLNAEDPLAEAIEAWIKRSTQAPAGVFARSMDRDSGDEIRECREDWYELLEAMGVQVTALNEKSDDDPRAEISDLLARRELACAPPYEIFAGGEVAWDGENGTGIVRDRSGFLRRLLNADPKICSADAVLRFHAHLRGLASFATKETAEGRVGALHDGDRIDRLLNQLFRRDAGSNEREFDDGGRPEVRVRVGTTRMEAILEKLDQALRRIEDSRDEIGEDRSDRAKTRHVAGNGADIRDWIHGIARRLRTIGCDWVPRSASDRSPLERWKVMDWSSAIHQVRLVGEWNTGQRLGRYEWNRIDAKRGNKAALEEQVLRLGGTEKKAGESATHAIRYWQERLAQNVTTELQRWNAGVERTQAGSDGHLMAFFRCDGGVQDAIDGLSAIHARQAEQGLFETNELLRSAMIEAALHRPPKWSSIFELAKEIYSWTIENPGPRRHACVSLAAEMLDRVHPAAERGGDPSAVEQLRFRIDLVIPTMSNSDTMVPIGADLARLRGLDSHHKLKRDPKKTATTIRRIAAEIGRRTPDSMNRPEGIDQAWIDSEFQLKDSEFKTIQRWLCLSVARAIGLFDVDGILETERYRATLEPWYKEEVLRRSGG